MIGWVTDMKLCDGAMLAFVVNSTARQFARAICMSNLAPPVTTTALDASHGVSACYELSLALSISLKA
jgi:dihydroorotase